MLRRFARPLVLPFARWHATRPHVHVAGADVVFVAPGVFDPVLTKVGAWLAPLAAGLVHPGERWLDVGTGSGIVALAMARAGARVVAIDIDEVACRNTRMNATLNDVEVDVREGDLFGPVAGERFDGVVANLPFWPGTGDSLPVGRAFAAGEDYALLRRFVREAPVLAPQAWIVLSEAFRGFPEARAALGTSAQLVRRERWRGEWLDLFRVEA